MAQRDRKRDRELRLKFYVEQILDSEQDDVIDATEGALIAMVRGATALRHIRMYPQFAAEAVHDSLRSSILRVKKGK